MPDLTEPSDSLSAQYKASSEHWQRQWAKLEAERDELRSLLTELYNVSLGGVWLSPRTHERIKKHIKTQD